VSSKRSPNLATVRRRPFECTVCGGGLFWHRSALLNTPGLAFFDLAWANRSANLLICADCGFVNWFLSEDPVIELWEPDAGYPTAADA
jgi:hypothetical protein